MKMTIPGWNYLSWMKDRFGATRALASYPRSLFASFVPVPTGSSVFLRPGTADHFVYDEVFRGQEYALDIPQAPKLIVDAGAHIGLASVFFSMRWPRAKVIAIEPNSENFRMLQRNAAAFPNIIPIQSGVWSKDTKLRIENPDAATWSFRVVESADGFPAITIDSIIRRYGPIDLLKLDIEGSEKTVLEHSASWIRDIPTLVIELHDRHVPGCTDALEDAIRDIPFHRSISGESVVLTRYDGVRGHEPVPTRVAVK